VAFSGIFHGPWNGGIFTEVHARKMEGMAQGWNGTPLNERQING